VSNTKRRGPAHAKTLAGGPGTHIGINYQTDFAVLTALRLMRESLATGGLELSMTIEPRLVGENAITAWDIRIQPESKCVEAKSNATGADVRKWLEYVAIAGVANPSEIFELVYSEGRTMLLSSLHHLARDAKEAPEASQFLRFANEVSLSGVHTVLDALGANAYSILRRVQLLPLPDPALQQLIDIESQQLAGPLRSGDLRNFLFEKFSKLGSNRLGCRILDLISDAQHHSGIKLTSPPLERIAGVSDQAKTILAALHACTDPLPAQVLLEAIDQAETQVANLVTSGRIVGVNDHYRLADLRFKFEIVGMERHLARVLESLLAFVESHGREEAGKKQIPNTLSLAHACARAYPKVVASIFPRLDKFLKDRGDKHTVLEAADLSIAAARRAPREEEIVKYEAKTLICGRSWVFQRIGRLDEAEIFGTKSLEIGENIPWPRNTAYCKKCLGRMYRLQAESASGEAKRNLLDKSSQHLNDAISLFEKLGESDSNEEMGDSLSLLARTYLVSGRRDLAERAAREARKLIPDDGRKDDLDLQILIGDLARASGRASLSLYDEAIRTSGRGSEFSEIRARAHFSRANARKAMKDMFGAAADFHKAFDIYNQLNEPEFAAQARWEELLLSPILPKSAVRILSGENYRVRVGAIEQFLVETEKSERRAIARRGEPPNEYWTRLAKDVRRQVQISSVDW
jgi:tetratricopeptide (TPR) repeat protein